MRRVPSKRPAKQRSQGVHPDAWPRPSGYSNGTLAPAGAQILAVAGQVGWDLEGRIVSPRFHQQFARALENVVTVVRAAGGAPADLIRLTIFVVDRKEYAREKRLVGAHYRRILGRHYPACTLVEVSGLLEKGAKVEIEATAAILGRNRGAP